MKKKMIVLAIDVGIANYAGVLLCVDDDTRVVREGCALLISIGKLTDDSTSLTLQLVRALRNSTLFMDPRIDHVVVEQQVPSAHKNIVIQTATMTFYETLRCEGTFPRLKSIGTIPARMKFDLRGSPLCDEMVMKLLVDGLSPSAPKLKRLSVDIVKHMCQINPDVLYRLWDVVASATKRDDVCDAFLMAYTHAMKMTKNE